MTTIKILISIFPIASHFINLIGGIFPPSNNQSSSSVQFNEAIVMGDVTRNLTTIASFENEFVLEQRLADVIERKI